MSYDPHTPHTTPHRHQEPVPTEPGGGITAYALVKYGFILLITIVVLYFLARYIIPLIRD